MEILYVAVSVVALTSITVTFVVTWQMFGVDAMGIVYVAVVASKLSQSHLEIQILSFNYILVIICQKILKTHWVVKQSRSTINCIVYVLKHCLDSGWLARMVEKYNYLQFQGIIK